MFPNRFVPESNPVHPAGAQPHPGEPPVLLSAVTLPAELLFQRALTPSVVFTYAQLQALALDVSPVGEWRTACLTLERLCALTGKRPAALYNHLRLLKVAGLLDWQAYPGQGLVIRCLRSTSRMAEEKIPDSYPAASPARSASSGGLTAAPAEPEGFPQPTTVPAFYGNRILPSPSLKTSSKKERQIRKARNGRARAEKNPAESCRDVACNVSTIVDAVQTYRDLARLTPNAQQRSLLHHQVHDLTRWRSTLEHWLAHGWNPRNLPGMLELYSRGGPEGCRYCMPCDSPVQAPPSGGENPGESPAPRLQGKLGRSASVNAIQQVRRLFEMQPKPVPMIGDPVLPVCEPEPFSNPIGEDRDG